MPVFPKFDYENNDITKIKMQDFCLLQNPQDPEQLAVLKSKTPARIAIGHTGARYPTCSYLRFRADQAAAADAVFSEVSEETVKELGLFEVRTKCENKSMMITRPDLGRLFDEDTQKKISENCNMISMWRYMWAMAFALPAWQRISPISCLRSQRDWKPRV